MQFFRGATCLVETRDGEWCREEDLTGQTGTWSVGVRRSGTTRVRFLRGDAIAELAIDGSNPPVHALVRLPRVSKDFAPPTWMNSAGITVRPAEPSPR